MNVLYVVFGIIIVLSLLIYLGIKTDFLYAGGHDAVPYFSNASSTEPKVKIHYGYEVGTSIVICPVSEIRSYTERFDVLSIEPYNEDK